MRAKLAVFAVVLLSASVAFAQRGNQSLTNLASPANDSTVDRGGNLVEDFETFPTGPLPIMGWTGFNMTHAIVSTNTIQGDRSWRTTSDGSGFSDTSNSPNVTPDFGIVAGMVRINNVGAPTLFQWNTVAPTANFNTRLNFETDGTIRALQAVGGMGVFLNTTGTWASGETFQIAIETTPAGVLNVYKNGANIFTGAEINFALGLGAQGTRNWSGFNTNATGSTGTNMTLDQFTNVLIPEPTSLALLAAGGVLVLRRRRA